MLDLLVPSVPSVPPGSSHVGGPEKTRAPVPTERTTRKERRRRGKQPVPGP